MEYVGWKTSDRISCSLIDVVRPYMDCVHRQKFMANDMGWLVYQTHHRQGVLGAQPFRCATTSYLEAI